MEALHQTLVAGASASPKRTTVNLGSVRARVAWRLPLTARTLGCLDMVLTALVELEPSACSNRPEAELATESHDGVRIRRPKPVRRHRTWGIRIGPLDHVAQLGQRFFDHDADQLDVIVFFGHGVLPVFFE